MQRFFFLKMIKFFDTLLKCGLKNSFVVVRESLEIFWRKWDGNLRFVSELSGSVKNLKN